MDWVNYVAYMGGEHKYMFDQENLLHILKMNGFKNVRQREFDPEIDMPERRFESLYAQGEKWVDVQLIPSEGDIQKLSK